MQTFQKIDTESPNLLTYQITDLLKIMIREERKALSLSLQPVSICLTTDKYE